MFLLSGQDSFPKTGYIAWCFLALLGAPIKRLILAKWSPEHRFFYLGVLKPCIFRPKPWHPGTLIPVHLWDLEIKTSWMQEFHQYVLQRKQLSEWLLLRIGSLIKPKLGACLVHPLSTCQTKETKETILSDGGKNTVSKRAEKAVAHVLCLRHPRNFLGNLRLS